MDTKGRTGFAEIPLTHIHHLKILMTTKREFLSFILELRVSATKSEDRLLKKWCGQSGAWMRFLWSRECSNAFL
jgi:hypothetical protein